MTRLFEAKPFIIAEVGSNWTNFSEAKDSIAMAKAVGADAVKFQAFDANALYGFPIMTASEQTQRRFVEDMPNRLPLDWLPKLKEKADACGIEFMCTAFSPELVKAVDPFVSVHKVASSDLSYPQLLQAVAKTGKPILLSTGASSIGDIQAAIDCTTQANFHAQIVLMYCVSAYPARTTNLLQMTALQNHFKRKIGLSDHSTDIIWTPFSAALAGAVVIEKHFTAFPDLSTPDRPHSLTTDEFKLMVDQIRGKRQTGISPSPEESAMFLRHNRRLIATKDLKPGETLRFGVNYGAYRTLEDDTRGLSPFAWNHPKGPEGRVVKLEVKRGKGLGPGDFG